MLTVGSLFAGIGGFDLGFERAGMRTEWQVEVNPFCQSVLERHFPSAQRYSDVREVGKHNLINVDLICGGFPCQDLSVAGRGVGLSGARSGLWSEFARIVGELRPRYVVVENVAVLRSRGLGQILGDLAEIGYDAEWDCIPASAVGAPHQRDRIWIIAYPNTDCSRLERPESVAVRNSQYTWLGNICEEVANSNGTRPQGCGGFISSSREITFAKSCATDGDSQAQSIHAAWEIEPDVGRVAYGISNRVDRLKALGNSLVPQIVEWIGWRIVAYEAEQELRQAA